SAAVLSAQKDTAADSGVRVVAGGGLRLSGKFENITGGKLKLTRAAIQEPLLLAIDQLQSLIVLNPTIEEEDTPNRLGRLELDGLRLHGFLVDGQKSEDASCLDWHPLLATNDSPLKTEISGRIVYRDPPPPAPKVIAAPQTGPAPPGLWDGFMKAYSTDGPVPIGAGPTLHLRTGDSIPLKRITHIDTDGVTFESDESSKVQAHFVPHEKIKAIELAKEIRTIPLDKTKRDRLLTLPRMQKNNPPSQLIVSTNGDYLRGRLVEMTDKTISVEVHLETQNIPRANVARIVWFHDDEMADKPAGKSTEKADEKATDKSAEKSEEKSVAKIEDTAAPPDKPVAKSDALPELLVQTLRNDGDRMTFSPAAVAHQMLSGKSDILGEAASDLKHIDQILIGKAIEENVAQLSYNRWKLHSAIEPRYVQDDEAGDADHPAGTQSALVGKPAPDFELNLLDGGKFRVSQNKGKVLVLDFFATWCGPCVGAMPQVEAAIDELKDRGVKLVAVNMQEDSKTIQGLLERLNLKPTVALDRDGVAAEKYSVTAIPQTVIIGADGNVARLFIGGGPEFADQLRQALKETLDGAAPSSEKTTSSSSASTTPAASAPGVPNSP
ncbi:MAG TPA: TlpA disulfide reductase family protein, partial [Pirellulales bacterium]